MIMATDKFSAMFTETSEIDQVITDINRLIKMTSNSFHALIEMDIEDVRRIGEEAHKQFTAVKSVIAKLGGLSREAIGRILESHVSPESLRVMDAECAQIKLTFKEFLTQFAQIPIPTKDEMKLTAMDIRRINIQASNAKKVLVEEMVQIQT